MEFDILYVLSWMCRQYNTLIRVGFAIAAICFLLLWIRVYVINDGWLRRLMLMLIGAIVAHNATMTVFYHPFFNQWIAIATQLPILIGVVLLTIYIITVLGIGGRFPNELVPARNVTMTHLRQIYMAVANVLQPAVGIPTVVEMFDGAVELLAQDSAQPYLAHVAATLHCSASVARLVAAVIVTGDALDAARSDPAHAADAAQINRIVTDACITLINTAPSRE